MANDPLFGIHADALQLQRRRMELLAANIANADTPGYRARDIDFQKLLAAAQQPAATAAGGAAATDSGIDDAKLKAATVFRLQTQPAVDGNTVDTQVEQSQFAQASLQYQASLSFMDGRLRSLLTAITGQ